MTSLNFDDKIWNEVDGGYRTRFNPTRLFRKFSDATGSKELEIIVFQLWDELHHQGDVGLASYLSLPHLVKLAKSKKFFHWSILGLCAVIEQQRVLSPNPKLPEEFAVYYSEGLDELKLYILANLASVSDNLTLRVACSALFTARGDAKLGKAIYLLDEDILPDFLSQF